MQTIRVELSKRYPRAGGPADRATRGGRGGGVRGRGGSSGGYGSRDSMNSGGSNGYGSRDGDWACDSYVHTRGLHPSVKNHAIDKVVVV
jgi:hypothetical protein